jgi:tetratricopeptide (TPR) repeat protein
VFCGFLGIAGALVAAVVTPTTWAWVERLSWLTGMAGSVLAVISLWGDRLRRRAGAYEVVSPREPGRSWRPGTTSIDVPVEPSAGQFLGREAFVEELASFMHRRNPGPRVHVLHGLGGCGKTSVALMLARRARRRGTAVWWISAATVTSLHTGMRHLASRLGAIDGEIDRAWSGVDSATDLVWRLLNKRARPWLLVIDNADEPQALASNGRRLAEGTGWLRPPATRSGHVVVTTRDGNQDTWGSWCRLHPVPMLSVAVGARVLLKLAGPRAGSAEDAEALARRLGGLPLALHLAGYYLAATAAVPWDTPTATFSGYAEAFDAGQVTELLGTHSADRSTDEQSRQVIVQAWESSLNLLEGRGLSQARRLLHLLSCFAEHPVPYQILLHTATMTAVGQFEGLDPPKLWQSLRELAHLGLIELVSDVGTDIDGNSRSQPLTLTIHPLVRQVSRAGTSQIDRTNDLALAADLLGRAADAEGLSAEDPTHWPLWQTLAPHAIHVLHELQARTGIDSNVLRRAGHTVNLAGIYLRCRGLHGQGESYQRAVIDVCQPVLGSCDAVVLAARHSLASSLRDGGQLVEAEAAFRSVLSDRTRVLGRHHMHTLASRHMLGYVLWDLGRYDEAESEFRTVLDTVTRVHGPINLLAVNSGTLLAQLLQERDQLDEAETHQRRALETLRHMLSADHPRILNARVDLAAFRAVRGQVDEAEREYHEVLTRQQQVIGSDHPYTLITRHRLAQLLRDQGHLAAAETAYQAVLHDRLRVLGAEHPVTVATSNELKELQQASPTGSGIEPPVSDWHPPAPI